MPGSAIFHKFPGILKFKPLILFFLKVLGLFAAFLFLKFIHRTLIDPSNESALSHFLREIDIYDLIANTIIYPAQWMLNFLGYQTSISERTLSVAGVRGVIIHAPCMGYNVMGAFVALVIAYPSRAKAAVKVLFIFAGLLGIHLLNIFRVSALTIHDNYAFEIYINHHDLFNIIIYSFVFMLFYCWIKYYSKSSVAVS